MAMVIMLTIQSQREIILALKIDLGKINTVNKHIKY